MSLHGFEVKPGKPTTFTPAPDMLRLFLKHAALPADSPKDARSSLLVKGGEMESELCIGTLSKKGVEHMGLELVLNEDDEVSVKGNCAIHVVGLATGLSDEDDGDGPEGFDLQDLQGLQFGQGADDDDEDDDDDYNESDDSDMARVEELEMEDKKKKRPNGVKKTPIVESPPSSSHDDDDDDDDDSDDDMEEPPTLSQLTPPKRQEKKKSKGKQPEAATPTPPPQQKGKHQKGSKREAAEMDSPAPKRAKDAEGKKQKGAPPTPQSLPSPASTANTAPTPSPGKRKDTRRFKNGFVIHNTKYGNPDGKVARKGKKVSVTYVGKLENGKVFDKTKGKNSFEFVLGAGQVIKGWDKGLEDMRVGDQRKLTVPPSMGYGAEGSPPVIPPNATLMFDVTLENVK
ncbi:hypothetical protein BSKO_03601 [Bryopsis sp. KO-2023]|nr:hypothetical protein BSKO_03601 [Bryopsis sp. KO-2023]